MKILLKACVLLVLLQASLQAKDGLNIDPSVSDEDLYAAIFNNIPASEPLRGTLTKFQAQGGADVSGTLDQLSWQLEVLCLSYPENMELHAYTGWIFFMRRKYSKSYDYLEKACNELNSPRCNDWCRLAVVEGMQNPQSPKQWQYFEKALGFDPNDYNTVFLRGLAFLRAGEYQKALDDFNRGIEINDNVGIHALRGFAYCGLGSVPQAIEDFEKYLAVFPNAPQPLLFKALATCYWQNEQYTRSLETLKKGENLFPENPDFSLMSYVIYLPYQNAKECQNSIDRSVKIAPDDPKVQLFDSLWEAYNGNSAPGLKILPRLEAQADEGLISHSFVDLLWKELALQFYDQTARHFQSPEFSKEDSGRFLKKLEATREEMKPFSNYKTVFQTMDCDEVFRLFM